MIGWCLVRLQYLTNGNTKENSSFLFSVNLCSSIWRTAVAKYSFEMCYFFHYFVIVSQVYTVWNLQARMDMGEENIHFRNHFKVLHFKLFFFGRTGCSCSAPRRTFEPSKIWRKSNLDRSQNMHFFVYAPSWHFLSVAAGYFFNLCRNKLTLMKIYNWFANSACSELINSSISKFSNM